MKKLLTVLIVFLYCTLSWSAEGTRTHGTKDGLIKVTMPEKAPDFLLWDGNILQGKNYLNGRGIAFVEVYNKEQIVWGMVLILREPDGSLHVILLQIDYISPEYKRNPDPRLLKTEYYEDVQFIKTNIPSDILVKVEKLTDWKILDKQTEKTKISTTKLFNYFADKII